MPVANVIDYGAVPNDESFDCAPAFLAAADAAGNKGTLVVPGGVWHIKSFPSYTGAFPKVQASQDTMLEFHLDTDMAGVPSPGQMEKFFAFHEGLVTEYALRLTGMGVEP